MPLTASLAGRRTLDATLDGLGSALPWEAVYRTRPRVPLTCTDCGLPMHAKVSGRGGRFFAHDRRSPHCAATGETEEHRSLKRALAAAARAAGHRAELEVTAVHRGWRADVLVTGPDGRRTALEAQVSSTSLDDVLERTLRYQDDGIEAVWFTYRAACWLTYAPSAHLYRPATPQSLWTRTRVCASRFSVVACAEICQPSPFWHSPYHAGWEHGPELGLAEFVADVLHGRLLPRKTTAARGTFYDGWAAPKDIEAAAEYAAARETPAPAPAYVPDPAAPWYQQQPPAEQQRLLTAAKAWVQQTTGIWPTARPGWNADWLAGGLALARRIEDSWSITRAALIRPDPARIDWSLIEGLPVIVGSWEEHGALAATAAPHAHIVVL
ncbi:competence protein CoiA family protein [Streptomyces sp. CA-135486]|uniref:competence protein CoiA family protein n=1 Tax=Streptomyces sp. CA-135486 TaxID=3240049 RepID=UPI003D93E6BB